MTLRRASLPPGWYPRDAEGVRESIDAWTAGKAPAGAAMAAVAPHAGWVFSGRLAALSVAALRPAQTVVVIGGHLPARSPILAAFEDEYETPLGPLRADAELRDALSAALARQEGLPLRSDEVPDNTVEVQLPLVKALRPDALCLWLRAPAGPAALRLGATLSRAAAATGRKVACLGSTDLTHYGSAYDYAPAGRGPSAETWVREVNDRAFIDALLALDPEGAIDRGVEDRSACSPGAAAAALAFALAEGAARADLLAYATSLEVRRDESFVGYSSVGFY